MPDYDLGTAHGRIRVESDTRGVLGAEAAMEGFEKALQSVSRQAAAFDASLKKVEAELNQVSRDFRKAAAAARDYEDAVDRASAANHEMADSFHRASSSAVEMGRSIDSTSKSMSKFAAIGATGFKMYRYFDKWSRIFTQTKGIKAWAKLISKGVFGKIAGTVSKVTFGILGLNKAISGLGARSTSLLQLAGRLAFVSSIVSSLTRSGGLLESVFDRLISRGGRAGAIGNAFRNNLPAFHKTSSAISSISAGFGKFLAGTALVKAGVKGLIGRFSIINDLSPKMKFALGTAFKLFPAAIQLAGKSLVWFSNTMSGLASAVKQLGGGFLALPGLVATAFAAFGPLMGIIGTLKSRTKDLFEAFSKNDPEAFRAALEAMPPYLRSFAVGIAQLIPKVQSLGDIMTQTFVGGGLENVVTAFVNGVFPSLAKGGQQVALSWRHMAVELMGFFGEAQTLSDLNLLFSNTAQILNGIAHAIKPVMAGMRDIGIVGSTFIKDLALTTMPGLARSFQDWASVNRQSGQLLKWMQDGALGVRQLIRGTVDLGIALGKIFTMFKTDGEHGFARFAELMDKFKKSMQSSAESGNLKKWGDAVRQLGTEKIAQAAEMFRDLGQVMRPLFESLMKISDTIRVIFTPVLGIATKILAEWIKILNNTPAPQIIGIIYGISGALKVLNYTLVKSVLGPLRNFFQILGGGGMMAANGFSAKIAAMFRFDAISKFFAQVKSLSFFMATDLVQRTGKINNVFTRTAVGSVGKLSGGLSKVFGLLSAAAGPVGIAVAAVAAVGAAIYTAAGHCDEFNQALDGSLQHLNQFRQTLDQTFLQSGGIKDKNVLSAVGDAVKQNMDDLKTMADKGPGLMDQIGSFFWDTNMGGNWADKLLGGATRKDNQGVNKWQKQSDDAKRAHGDLQKLVDSGVNLGDKISQGSAQYNEWLSNLKKTGQVSNEGAEALGRLRDAYQKAEVSAKSAGPASLQLADGIAKMGAAGNDAQTKLEGLKTALQGLGLMQQSSFEAAAAFEKSIQELGNNAVQAAGGFTDFGNIIQNGFINPADAAGRALYDTLKPSVDAFLASAAKGDDVGAMWQKMSKNLASVAEAFHLTSAQAEDLVQKMGVVPDTVDILVKLSDTDENGRKLAEMIAAMQSSANDGVTVPVHFGNEKDARAFSDKVNKMVGSVISRTDLAGNVNLSSQATPEQIQKVKEEAAKQYKLDFSDTGKLPGGQKPIPLPKEGAPAPAAPFVPSKKTPEEEKAAKQAPAAIPQQKPIALPPGMPAPTGVGTAGATPVPAPAKPAVGTIPQQIAGVLGGAAVPQVAPVGAKPPVGIAPAPSLTQVPATQPVSTEINIGGLDKAAGSISAFTAALDSVKEKLNEFKSAVEGSIAGVVSAIDGLKTAAVGKLEEVAVAAKNAGMAFTTNFADGIGDAGSIQKVSAAAQRVAKEAADHMPHSPAKKGPLSGRGWSGFAGLAFANDFAGGVSNGVSNISSSVAEAAAAAKFLFEGITKGVPDASSAFMGQLKQLTEFAGKAYQIISSGGDTTTSFLQYISDPTGSGNSFFGKPLPFKRDPNLTDDDLDLQRTTGDNAESLIYSRGFAGLKGNLDPSKDSIVAAIAGEAAKRGYDRNTAVAVISAAMRESSLNPNIVNATGHKGLFQQDTAKPLRDNASQQIQWMFNTLDSLGGPRATAANPLDFIATQVEKGGYDGSGLARFAVDADKMLSDVMRKVSVQGVTGSNLDVGGGGYSSNPASIAGNLPSANDIGSAIRAQGDVPRLYQPGQGPPQWMKKMAEDFGLTVGTRDNTNDLHGMGFAGDFNGPAENLKAFASYITDNLAGQTLQLIYEDAQGQKYGIAGGKQVGPGTDQPNYYSEAWGDHSSARGNMPHVHWATDVAPLVGGEGSQSQQLALLRQQNPELDEAIRLGMRAKTEEEANSALNVISGQLISLGKGDTPEAKAQIQALSSVRDQIAKNQGMVQQQSPVANMQNMMSGMNSIVNDVIAGISAGMDAIGGAKDISDVLVRGVANTQDVGRLVDDVQKFITFAATVAQGVADTTGVLGQFASSGGPWSSGASAGLQGASAIASAIAGVLQGINATIDLTQEALNIFGSYFGDFLGYLTGGANSLRGNVQFLLDQNTGQLMAYSTDNPMQKVGHYLPGQIYKPEAAQQGIGQINVYGGPGIDPRDSTRQMLFQVKAAGYAGAMAG